MNLLPLLLNLTLPLQRARPLLPAPHRDAGEPDWRSAYQRLRGEEQPPADELAMPLPVPASMAPRDRAEAEPEAVEVRLPTARVDAPRRPTTESVMPAWQSLPAASPNLGESPRRAAAQAPRADDPALPQGSPAPLPLPTDAKPEMSEARPASSTLPTPAVARIEALLQLGEPAPVARVWQVELPGAGPAWQLQVQQAQPQAPLNLELRVPPVAQSQARQQLSDLDKRLRDAGHDVLRSRLRDSRGRGPVEGVKS